MKEEIACETDEINRMVFLKGVRRVSFLLAGVFSSKAAPACERALYRV